MASLSELTAFSQYFSGSTKSYGLWIPGKNENGEFIRGDFYDDNGKKLGENSHINGEANIGNYTAHLAGNMSLGIVPVNMDGESKFGVIDVDIYRQPEKLAIILRAIEEFSLPFIPFRSKSNGLHLYTFMSTPAKSGAFKDHLSLWATVFGITRLTYGREPEIFPKQRIIGASEKERGSYINLPYFGDSRHMVGPGNKNMPLQAALDTIKNKATTLEQLIETYKNLPFNDGPPCLQSLYMLNDTPLGEMYLFNFAAYFKSKNAETWKDEIHKVNARLDDPLEHNRVESQVIGAHEKTSYSYMCGEEPICARCNRAQCVLRPLGKESNLVSSLNYEQLTQVLAQSPFYKWRINGKELVFYNEAELRGQEKFADQVMRYLHVVPNKLVAWKWLDILRTAFNNITIEEVDQQDDMSPGAMLMENIWSFLYERPRASHKNQISKLGRAYFDKESRMFYWRKKDLLNYLDSQGFNFFNPIQIQERIQRFGAKPVMLYAGPNAPNVRVWAIHEDVLLKATGAHEMAQEDSAYQNSNDDLVDFSKGVEQEQKTEEAPDSGDEI